MKIAYIGIDFMIAALHAIQSNGCEIVEIFTCKTDNKTEFNTEVTAMAKQLGVACQTEPITESDIKRLEEKKTDLILCAGYYHKVPTKGPIPIVNVHPAMLPVGRGAWPMPVTILKGLSSSGVTFHKMTEKMDMGDIILQKSFPVSEKENLQSFMKKVSDTIEELIPVLLHNFEALYAGACAQGDGEYWAMPTEEDWTVTPEMEPEQIDRIFRAFFGYECIWQENGKKYELIGAKIRNDKPEEDVLFKTFGTYYITATKITGIE